ncbi:MAG: hypothetical protein QOI21_5471 [Actinomycetota bacterium]|nr:hypothetical protein [Actinomycetota bacterium]
MDGQQIYTNFTGGDTAGLRTAADRIDALTKSYLERAQSIKGLQDRMKQAWTGSAADAAGAGAGPLELAFVETAQPLDMTRASVDAQVSSFDSSGHAVVPVPPKPDKPSPWSIGLKSMIPVAGPFMAADDVSSYQEGVAKHNAANDNNVRVMDQYSSATSSTRSVLPTDFGLLESDGAAIAVKQPDPPGPIGPLVPPPKATKPNETINQQTNQQTQNTEQTTTSGLIEGKGPGDPTMTHPGGVTTQNPTGTGGTTGIGGTTLPTGTTGVGTKPGGTTGLPGGQFPGAGKPGGGKGGGLPLPDGVVFNPGGSKTGVPGTSGLPGAGGPGAGTGGGASGRGGAGGRLLGGDLGESAGGRGTAGESSRALGKGSGVGGFGGAAGEGVAGRGATAGGSGARGAGGTGPAGGAGRRGEGDDDGEHQRPDFLIEPDPDALFGTDQRTTPPVIGE